MIGKFSALLSVPVCSNVPTLPPVALQANHTLNPSVVEAVKLAEGGNDTWNVTMTLSEPAPVPVKSSWRNGLAPPGVTAVGEIVGGVTAALTNTLRPVPAACTGPLTDSGTITVPSALASLAFR